MRTSAAPPGGASDADAGGSRKSSIGLSVATLLKNMIGAGIFSLPIGLLRATPLPGLLLLTLICIISGVSFWMLGYCCATWKVASFRELWDKTMGESSAWIIDMTIFLNGWFTLVCYVVLIGDFSTKSFEGLLGSEHLLARNRRFDLWLTTLTLLMPLSLAKDLRKLAFTSILGLCVTVYAVMFVLLDAYANTGGSLDPSIPLLEWRLGIFEAIALYTHAFVAHYNAPKIFSELKEPTPRRWGLVVMIAYSTCLAVYAAFALAGLLRYGREVQGNVLRNFGPEFKVLIAWLGMGFSIAFTYPLVFNTMREACVNLFSSAKGYLKSSRWYDEVVSSPRVRRLSTLPRSTSLLNVLGPSPRQTLTKHGRSATTIALVASSALVGTLVEDVGLVNALAGTVMGCAVAFLFPALLFFLTMRQQLTGTGLSGRNNSSLSRPLLSSPKHSEETLPKVKDPAHRFALNCGMAMACLIAVSGVIFAVVGTVVILQGDR